MPSPELLSSELQRPELPAPHAAGFLSARALLKNAWTLYRSRFWTLLGIVFIPLAVVLLLTSVFLALGEAADNAIAWRMPLTKDIVLFGSVILVWILAWFLQLWSELALLYALKDAEEKIGIRESFSRGFAKILPYLWVTILGGLLTLGSFLLFFLPGIVMLVWFFPALYVLVSENERGFRALAKSKKYVEGYWLAVVWRLLLLAAIWIAAMAPFMILDILTNIPDDWLDFLSAIPAIFLTPFATAYIYLLYRALKDAKGGEVAPTGRDKKILVGIPMAGFLLVAAAVVLAILFF